MSDLHHQLSGGRHLLRGRFIERRADAKGKDRPAARQKWRLGLRFERKMVPWSAIRGFYCLVKKTEVCYGLTGSNPASGDPSAFFGEV